MPAADAFTAELRRPFGISVAAKLARLREAGAERRRWSYAAPAAVGSFVCRWRAADDSDATRDVNDSHN